MSGQRAAFWMEVLLEVVKFSDDAFCDLTDWACSVFHGVTSASSI
jgi:hypothetical protein